MKNMIPMTRTAPYVCPNSAIEAHSVIVDFSFTREVNGLSMWADVMASWVVGVGATERIRQRPRGR